MDTSYFVPLSAVFAISQQIFTLTMPEETLIPFGNAHHTCGFTILMTDFRHQVLEERPLIIERLLHLVNFGDRKSTRLNSSHVSISYAVFCLKKKKNAAKSVNKRD